MAKKRIINTPLTDLTQPWGGTDSQGMWGYAFDKVEGIIKDSFGKRVGIFHYDTSNNRYLCFADEDARDAYLEDPVTNNGLLLGTFDAPFNYSAHIHVESSYMSVLKGATGTFLEYTFEILNKEGGDTGDDINVTYTIANGGTKQTVNSSYASGTSVRFLVDSYLRTGENRITIAITGASTLAATTQVVTIFVVDLQIESAFDMGHVYATTDAVAVPYVVSGVGVKTVECYLDGTLATQKTGIAENTASGQFSINLSSITGLGEGRHWIQVRAKLTVSGVDYYSKTLFFHFHVGTPQAPVFLFGKELGIGDINSTGTLRLACVQYEELSLQWVLIHPTVNTNSVSITTPDGTTNVTATSGTAYTFSYQPLDAGTGQSIVFAVDNTSETLYADVDESDLGISETTDDLVARLVAFGRSNTESARNTWAYNNVNLATFTDFEWTAQSGWNGEALVVKKGTSASINVQPFLGLTAAVLATRGVTVEIDFETDNVDDEDAVVVSCWNDGKGFKFTATEAIITTQLCASVSTKFKPKDRQRIALTMNSRLPANVDRNLLTIVNNGMIERAAVFADSDFLNIASTISIGSQYATVKIYSIRVYSRDLSVEQCFGNYAVGSPNRREIVNANDVLNQDGTVSYEKVRAMIPTFLFTTPDMNVIFNAQDKKANIRADVEYHNPQDPERDFTITTAYVCPQGTSSLAYPIKNLRLYTQKKKEANVKLYDAHGDEVESCKYSFKAGAQPVDCWTLKADYAESSMSHNTGTARLWNSLMKNLKIDNKYVGRTRAMQAAEDAGYQYDVRMAIDGFPCCVFYRDSVGSEPIFMGQFNFDNDKSTESVFGFKGLPDGGTDDFGDTFADFKGDIECWELLNNADDLCLFKDDDFYTMKVIDNETKPAWEGAFEARYPDDGSNADTVHLKAFASWLAAKKNLTAQDRTDFATEKWEHLDVYKVAAYYIYAMRHGAVDQLVKNSMLTTEGFKGWKRVETTTTVNGVSVTNVSIQAHTSQTKKYFYQWYDNDTIHGINNDSRLVYPPYIDRQSIEAGTISTYAYAGHESVMWNLLEGDAEFMGIVQDVDRALGVTYAQCCNMYDVLQSSVWPARLYNASQRYKYIEQFRSGADRLYMLQGSRMSHRHWWLKTRYDLYDSRFVSGDYRNSVISFKVVEGFNQDSSPFVGTFTVTSGDRLFYGYGINNTVEAVTPTLLDAGQSVTFTPRHLVIGDPVKIFGASHILELDLSDYAHLLNSLDLSAVYDADSGCRLKKLVLGKSGSENNIFTGLSVQGVPTLEEIDVTGFSNGSITGLNTLTQLHKLRAGDSGLTEVSFAEGVTLTQLVLPSTLQVLQLNRANVTGMTYTPTSTLINLSLRNGCTGLDSKSLAQTWTTAIGDGDYTNRTLIIEGLEWSNVDIAWLCGLYSKGWEQIRLTGTIHVSSLTGEEIDFLDATFGQNWTSPTNELVFDVPQMMIVSAPSQITEGDSATFTARMFPDSSAEGTLTWSILSGSRTGTSINASTGVLTSTENGAGTATLTIRATFRPSDNSGNRFGSKTITIVNATYPTSSSTLTEERISDSHRIFHLNLAPEGTTGHITTTWSVTGDASSHVTTQVSADGLDYDVVITLPQGTPALNGTINLAVKKAVNNNSLFSKTKTFGIVDDTIAVNIIDNRYVMASLYSKLHSRGLCENQTYMTKAEAAQVTEADLQTGTSHSTGAFYSNRNNITSFNEFKWFTGLTKVPLALFANCTSLVSIELPQTVVELEEDAFYSCSSLTTINLDNISTYGGTSMRGTPITSLEFKQNVSIGNSAFAYCRQLTTLIGSNYITSLGSQAFYECNNLAGDIDLSGVTSWGASGQLQFTGCTKIESITLNNAVTSIPYGFALRCSSLTSFHFPTSLTSIGQSAFSGCGFTSYTANGLLTSIGESAFENCTSLISVNTSTGSNLKIYPSAFRGCPITDLRLTDRVMAIGNFAFVDFVGTSLYIPRYLDFEDSSGNPRMTDAVFGTSNLQTITTHETPSYGKYIENNMLFSNKSGKKTLQLGNSVSANAIPSDTEVIYHGAFYGTSRTSISIPASVDTIRYSAFAHSSLTSIVIPSTVTTLGSYVLQGCTSLLSAECNFAGTLEQLFDGCTSLTSVSIPYATILGNYCFRNCNALTRLVIPATVTNVYSSALPSSSSVVFFFRGNPPTTSISEAIANICYVPYNSYDDYVDAGYGTIFTNLRKDFEPTSMSALSITADDAMGRATTTKVYYTATADGYDLYLEQNVTGKSLSGSDNSDTFTQNPSTTTPRQLQVSYTRFGLTAYATITQAAYETKLFTVDLNANWQASDKNVDATLYDAYESFSNYHVNSGKAWMYIHIDGYTQFTIYVRSYGESFRDYVQVGTLDELPVSGSYNGSTTKAHTRTMSTSSYSSLSNYVTVTFDNIDGGEHTIAILYKKDGSANSGDDKGYVLIPKNQ